MEKLIFLKNNSGQGAFELLYHEELNYLCGKWSGSVSLSLLQSVAAEVFHHAARFVQAKQCRYFVADYTEATGVWTKSLPWMSTCFLPHLLRQGMRHYLIVQSHDIFSKLSAQLLAEKSPEGIVIQLFDNMTAAHYALRDKKTATVAAEATEPQKARLRFLFF